MAFSIEFLYGLATGAVLTVFAGLVVYVWAAERACRQPPGDES